jgi:hypothetical protein
MLSRIIAVTRSKQIIEQSSEMHHRLAQLFGAGPPLVSAQRDRVSGPVVLNHSGVLHRHIGRPLLEVFVERIAPVVHHLLYEHVSFTNRRPWVVDELALSHRPALQVALEAAGASGRISNSLMRLRRPANSRSAER